ncbi:MAG: alpha/beta hydrolase-fold protein [Wenzhouxiangella sp.]|nr:alpha/beta hydrolase-fold protein [Wenzhouxiangella sp.]
MARDAGLNMPAHAKRFRPESAKLSGRLDWLDHRSSLLLDNPLGDPSDRQHPVYLPPGYDETDQRYPVLLSLAAYTNAGPGQVAWRNHGESLPQRLDRLIEQGTLPPVIAVFPDCYTSLGGNQYVNSPAIGAYADYLVDELLPLLDAKYRTLAQTQSRAVFGKSSGGFGALHLVMKRPGIFAAAASHAGDCGFDRVYPRDFPATCDVLARYDNDLTAFVRAFWRKKRPGGADFHAMMTLCLAASYSPAPDQALGCELPFDLETCELKEAVWQRWLDFDPARCASEYSDHLADLAGLWIDAGNRDQYFIHYGTRQLHRTLSAAGIAHFFEEFDGTHSGIDWRYDHSLPWMVQRLKLD